MNLLGKIGERDIIYIRYDRTAAWFNDLPKSNWLLFAIADRKQIEVFEEIARRSIDHDVVYVCSAGSECELFHDCFDEDIVIREVENGYLPKHLIMTTWHNHFEEGFWFASSIAQGDEIEINKMICLNISSTDISERLSECIIKINSGLLPPEEVGGAWGKS